MPDSSLNNPALNSLRHGGCSNILIMPNESLAEYEQLRDSYVYEYSAGTHIARDLILNVVKARWLTLRNDRNLYEAEQRLYAGDRQAWDWTEEEHHKLQLFNGIRRARIGRLGGRCRCWNPSGGRG